MTTRTIWTASRPSWPLVAAAAAVALLALIPLMYVVGYGLSLGLGEGWEMLNRPRVRILLGHTLALVVGVVALTTVIGVGCAWIVERTNLFGRSVWHLLFAAPLAIPAFVNSYGWVSVTTAVQSYAGAVLVVSMSYFPLVYLPVVAALRGVDPALEDVAHSLNSRGLDTFRRVVFPSIRPAVLGGGLLVALHCLAEFGALQMLAFPTFTTAIYDQYRSAFNSPLANLYASVLVLLCLVLLLMELRLRGHARVARVGSGVTRPIRPTRLGRWQGAVGLLAGAVVALSLGVPISSLVRWLLVGTSTEFPVAELSMAALTTAGYAAAAALLAVVLVLPVAWLVVRHPAGIGTWVERATFLAHALPGIVVALALVAITIRWAQPIYQSALLMVIAYVILFVPRALVSIRPSLEQAPPVYDEVARSLGQSPLAIARRVTLPMIRPGIMSGAALVFLAVSTELTATLLLSPIGTRTLATGFWSNAASVQYGAAAPYALLLIVLSIPATWLVTRRGALGVTT